MSLMSNLKNHYKVEIVDDERRIGNGIIITLKEGWSWDLNEDNRVRGFDSAVDALRAVGNDAKKFEGELTK